MLQLIKNVRAEFEKRFSKNGEFQKNIAILKEWKKKYPKNEDVKKMLQIFRQKIYGIKGANFVYEKITDIFENRFPFLNGVFEIENVKFDLTSRPARVAFCYELMDILLNDEHFKKTENHDVFYPLMQIISSIFTENTYQSHSVFLKSGDVVVDAGANIGMFSLFANKFYACKCYAFEPIKSVIDLLEKNIALNHKESAIEVIPYALSNKECDANIQVDLNILGSLLVRNQGNTVGLEKIHCITLDQWVNENHISKIDFIKADIEGSERYMLSGATGVLQKFAPKLSICTYHLPDDPQVLEGIILRANPKYKIEHARKKLYAYLPE